MITTINQAINVQQQHTPPPSRRNQGAPPPPTTCPLSKPPSSVSTIRTLPYAAAAAKNATQLMVGLTLIEGAAEKLAVCLDGTPAGYHIHRGLEHGVKTLKNVSPAHGVLQDHQNIWKLLLLAF